MPPMQGGGEPVGKPPMGGGTFAPPVPGGGMETKPQTGIAPATSAEGPAFDDMLEKLRRRGGIGGGGAKRYAMGELMPGQIAR